jgi:hypothetical protein
MIRKREFWRPAAREIIFIGKGICAAITRNGRMKIP